MIWLALRNLIISLFFVEIKMKNWTFLTLLQPAHFHKYFFTNGFFHTITETVENGRFYETYTGRLRAGRGDQDIRSIKSLDMRHSAPGFYKNAFILENEPKEAYFFSWLYGPVHIPEFLF